MKVTASQVSYGGQYIESGDFSMINDTLSFVKEKHFSIFFSECDNYDQNGIPCPDGKYCVDKHCRGNFIKGSQ